MSEDQTYTRAVALLGFPEFIEKRGGKAQTLFDKVGLDIDGLNNHQALISWPRCCNLLELAAKTLDLPNLGLIWAQNLPEDLANAGPHAYLAALMPDVITLIEMILKYQKLHTNGIRYSYDRNIEGGYTTGYLDFHPETPASRQYAEHILALTSLAVRRFIGPPYDNPLEVRFQHSEPADLALHQKIFNCPIIFDAGRTAMSYDIKILDQKMGRRWPLIKRLLDEYLKRQQKKLPKTSTPMKTAISSLIPYILASGKSDIISVAHVLDMSPKKVQRLLKQEGTTYSDLLDKIRAQSAKRMLLESNMSITRIANMLDYSSTRPFANACIRWYGSSPRALRNELQNES